MAESRGFGGRFACLYYWFFQLVVEWYTYPNSVGEKAVENGSLVKQEKNETPAVSGRSSYLIERIVDT